MQYDVIIIGKGPAGISAALYTVRANLKTLILGIDSSVLKKADKIENYYGFETPVDGKYLLEQGVLQAKRIGTTIIEEEVISIEKEDDFKVVTSENVFYSKAVLMATGQSLAKVDIKNIKQYEGKGVSYCTTCDGFFYRGKKVGVLGYKDFAIHEAQELQPFTKDITIYTNGKNLEISELQKKYVKDYKINDKKISKIFGEEFFEGVLFEDGTKEAFDGIFVAYDSASSVNFALKLGVMTKNNSIIVDSEQKTNIDGLFAAGDCTAAFKQISVAVGQGAVAGRSVIEYVRAKSKTA